MRASFLDLTAQRDSILAAAGPLRAARDRFVKDEIAPLEAKRAGMDAAIADAESGLYEVNQEIGRFVRNLGGKTGSVGG